VHFDFDFQFELASPYHLKPLCESTKFGVLLRVTRSGSFGRASLWVPIPKPNDQAPDRDTALRLQVRHAMETCGMGAFIGYAFRYLPASMSSAMRSVPLAPGMRVRLERAGGLRMDPSPKIQPFLGVGTTTVNVLQDESGVFFDAFSRVANITPSADLPGIVSAAAPLDLNRPLPNPPAFRYWRALFPGRLTPASSIVPPRVGQQVVFVGVDSLDSLEALFASEESFELELERLCAVEAIARCVIFPWHTYAVVEIPVTVQGQSTFVSLGTTLGDVATRDLNGARSDDRVLGYSELNHSFKGRLELQRYFGAHLVPVELPFDEAGTWTRIPLAQGDVVSW
jgi:hypothetical protein